jgi:hypothetical protein
LLVARGDLVLEFDSAGWTRWIPLCLWLGLGAWIRRY